jgi:hypothetical protein
VNAQVRPRIDEVPTLTEVIGFSESAAAAVAAQPDVAGSPVRRPPGTAASSASGPLSASLLDGLPSASEPSARAGASATPAGGRRDGGTADELALAPLAEADVPVEGWLAVAETQITQQVLSDVQRQVDRMFEYRVREVLGPVLARLTDQLIEDARHELAATLRDVVRRAVAQELARLRGR